MVPGLVHRLIPSARMLCLIQTCMRLRDLMGSEMLDGVSRPTTCAPMKKYGGKRNSRRTHTGACVPVTHVPRCVSAAGVLVGNVSAAKAEPDRARRQAHEVLALQGLCHAPEGAGVKHDGGTLYIALHCNRLYRAPLHSFSTCAAARRFIIRVSRRPISPARSHNPSECATCCSHFTLPSRTRSSAVGKDL